MDKQKNMVRALSENGGVVFCALDSTDMVRRMEELHKTGAEASAALGRLLTAASMMGIMLKNTGDSITLRVKGDGPLGLVMAVRLGVKPVFTALWGDAMFAHGIRYFLMVVMGGIVWPMSFRWFARMGHKE